MRVFLVFLVILIGFTSGYLLANAPVVRNDEVHNNVVSRISDEYADHIAHHLMVGGIPAKDAKSMASAAIDRYSRCIILSAIAYSKEFKTSFDLVIGIIIHKHWDFELYSGSANTSGSEISEPLAQDCADQLRDFGGLQN